MSKKINLDDQNSSQNREVDKLPLDKSKKYLWRYLQNKMASGAKTTKSSLWRIFTPLRLGMASGVAALLVVALIVTQNFGFVGMEPSNTAFASFEMEVNQEDSTGINEDAFFTLNSNTDFDEDDIKEILTVSPDFSFEVERTKESTYKITPNSKLQGNTVYNFRIKGTKEIYSWAYQVKEALKIDATIPGNQATYVPIESGIEIDFNHDNFDIAEFEKNFEISPKVAGKFDKKGNTAIFIPTHLEYETFYTVTVKKEFALENDTLKLSEDFTFKFLTTEESDDSDFDQTAYFRESLNEMSSDTDFAIPVYYYGNFVEPYIPVEDPVLRDVSVSSATVDMVEEVAFEEITVDDDEGEEITLKVPNPFVSDEEVPSDGISELEVEVFEEVAIDEDILKAEIEDKAEMVNENVVDIEIFKYEVEDHFIEDLGDIVEAPYWAFWGNSHDLDVDTSRLKSMGKYESLIFQNNMGKYISVPDLRLEKGFYLVEIQDGKKSQALLQVSDLAAFLKVTTTDTLVWLNNVKTGEPSQNAAIQLLSDNKDYKTDKNGISRFESSFLEEYTDGGENDFNSNSIIRMSEGDDILYKMVQNYTYMSAKDLWFFMTMDRPMYLPDDSVKFWGFLKDKATQKSPDQLRVELSRGREILEDLDINVDKGYFEGQVELQNYLPGYYTISIYDDEGKITEKYFTIKEYVKPSYQLSVAADKKHYFVTEDVNIDIKSAFFEGTPLPDLDLSYYRDNNPVIISTDEDGEARVTLKNEQNDSKYGGPSYQSFSITPKLGESTDLTEYINYMVHPSKYYMNATYEIENGVSEINVDMNYLDMDAMNENPEDSYLDYLGESVVNQKISGKISTYRWEKEQTGSSYDYINKVSVPEYRYNKVFVDEENFEMKTDLNGNAKYQVNVRENMYYEVELWSDDGEIGTAQDYMSFEDRGDDYYWNYEYLDMEITNGEELDWKHLFKIGDTVKARITRGDKEFEDEEGQSYLFMDYNNGLQNYELSDDPTYSSEFTEDYIPSMNIDAAVFDGTTYKVVWGATAYLNLDEKRLSIDFETDQESYEPGDMVKLKVKVSDKDGDGVESTVHVTLIDEAYYKMVYDYLENPLDAFYATDWNGIVDTEFSQRDLAAPMSAEAGMGGCFSGDTLILMADGSYKAISEIRVGDMVLTRSDEFSNEKVSAKVLKTYEHFVDGYLLVNGKLKVTGEHILFINGKWDHAFNLKVGDYLLNEENEFEKIYSIEDSSFPLDVYNFEVEGLHTYFAGGFYVHNDKGGDGVRSDFEDNAVFEMLETDSNGNASLEFQLPDNISSWRATVRAIDAEEMHAGMESKNIDVSLPLFADVVMNQEYSINDEPSIKARAYGDSLEEGDDVSFKMGEESQDAKAFDSVYFDLTGLEEGENDVTVSVESGDYEDALMKEFDVIKNRFTERVIETDIDLQEGEEIVRNEDGITEITFTDTSRTFYRQQLWKLFYSDSYGVRLDQLISKKRAAFMLNKYVENKFDMDDFASELEYQTEMGGLSLLPYSSEDLSLTTLFVLMADSMEGFDISKIRYYLNDALLAEDITPQEYVEIMAAKAALGDPVLMNLRGVDQAELDSYEKLILGIAFARIGDIESAKEIYNALKDETLNVNDRGLVAVLAASVGDDSQAYKLWTDTELEGLKYDLINIYRLGLVSFLVENDSYRAKDSGVRFVLNKGGEETKVDLSETYYYDIYLEKGEEISVSDIENGKLSYTSNYEVLSDFGEIETDDRISIERQYFVDGEELDTFDEGDMVEVRITVSENKYMANNSYYITDILPSGLRMMETINTYGLRNLQYYPETIYRPAYTEKQVVKFYVWVGESDEKVYRDSGSDDEGVEKTFSYFAKVISPGKYYAEPVKVETVKSTDLRAIGEEDVIEIK